MVDWLVQLMEQKNYQRCLSLADQFVMQNGWSLSEMATIHFVICRCKLATEEYDGAVVPGTLAVRFAREAEAYDLLGRALLSLGTAYFHLQRYDRATDYFQDYFNYKSYYQDALLFEGAIWKHLGITHQRNSKTASAIHALDRAREWYMRAGMDWGAFTTTHDLINTYLHLAESDATCALERVKGLLERQREIAQRHAMERFYQGTYLLDLAAWYRLTGRLNRAKVSAARALEIYQGDPRHACYCHLLLHRCYLEEYEGRLALLHAVKARAQAMEGQLGGLVQLASQAMVQVIRQEGEQVLHQLDAEYQALGVDLGLHLAPWVERRDFQ